MAHLWTPQDLPADFKLGWYHFPDSSTVTLDANGKIASIENKFDNGSRPCATADATKRHLLRQYNGFDTAFSDTTSYGGILMTNTSGLPTGNADLCMIFIQAPQDGVVGGYKGGTNYWVDNPYPDYRMRTDKGDYTLTGTTNNSTLHVLIVNRKSGTSTFRVDGMARGSQTPSGGYNTTLGTFGIKGADTNYYVQKGSSLGAIVGKRAATADEMYLIEKWYSTFTGQTVQSDNPYINGLPMVADASDSTGVTGTAATTLTAVAAASTALLAIAGAAAITLSPVSSTAAGSAPIAAQASSALGPIGAAGAGGLAVSGSGAAAPGTITGAAAGALPITGTGAAQIGSVTAAASGSLPVSGAGSATLGPVTSTSASRADISGTASATLGPVIASGTGGTGQLTTGQAAIVLAPVTAAAAGALPVSAAAATSLGAITAAGGGQLAARGQAAATLGAVTVAAVGSAPRAARAAAQLAPIGAVAAGSLPIAGIGAATLGPITIAATAIGDPDRPVGPAIILPQHRFVVPARQRSFTVPRRSRAFIIRKGICMSSITKYPAEERQYQADWTADLAGQTITGDPAATSSDPTLTVDGVDMAGAIMKYWLRGGTSGRAATITFVAPTSGGEDLVFQQTVIVY
ncbi:phage fiber-tail adaptor protein [Sphingomonas sp. CV7422]|uniref:phage fiber-tail adaptor protein n=1 Tax=Sphingomonas sp. CV7422 TaxID=3018036 RepID=UPI0022FE9890|nr:hypothetical protein [Sphingomonas sp. CV7422]